VISAEQIFALYQERLKASGPLLTKWREVAQLANGEVTVPLPELDKREKATVVNLFPSGLDALATRAGSVMPDQSWPALRDGIDASENRARARRQAGLAWWDMNQWQLLTRKWMRYFFGYGAAGMSLSPISASPLDKREIPHFRVRNPMTAFPAPWDDDLSLEPADIIWACRRSRAWLRSFYGAQLAMLNTGPADRARADDLFDVLEYNDADETVLVACGRSEQDGAGLWTPSGFVRGAPCVELERVTNRAGVPLVVMAGRITLDRLQGALDHMIPAYHRAARLNALNELAIGRGIYPEQWVVAHPGDPQAPEIITYANGLTGVVGEIAHGTIMTLGNPPAAAQQADMAIDRLERSQRLAAGLPAEIGGESGSNIRTARRGEQVLGSAIDMPIQEAQEIRAAAAEAELRRCVALMKGWYGSKQTSFYVPRDGSVRRPDYTPDDTFETDEVYVKFPMAGTDANSLVIALGQRVNMGTMSLQTARETDPVIEDPIGERDRVEVEGLTRALLASLEQGAQQGTVAPEEIAQIAKAKFQSHDQLFDVVIAVHQKMQERQAAQAQMPSGAPGTQPGIGGGAPQPGAPPSPFSGPPSSAALAQILGNLRGPANQSAAERTGGAPAPSNSPVMAGA
jgi:hypothetical protein